MPSKSGKKKKASAKAKIKKLRHRRFCELYALDMDLMGNGTRAYAVAFDVNLDDPEVYKKSYSACRANASELLTKANILAYINELLDDYCLNDTQVDKQLAYVILQQTDLKAKMSAIKEYNRLRARVKDKLADSVESLATALHRANTR
jgi:hypothetical protein